MLCAVPGWFDNGRFGDYHLRNCPTRPTFSACPLPGQEFPVLYPLRDVVHASRRPTRCLLAVVFLLVTAFLASCAQEPFEARGPWPEFRGPGGQGLAADDTPLPTSWGPDSENIRWRVKVEGVGNSSPIVAGDQVVITVADPRDDVVHRNDHPGADPGTGPAEGPDLKRSVVSFDLATGKQRWRTDIFSAPPEKGHFLSTNAAPTPLTDGRHIWVYYGQYLAKLTLDGEVVWLREIDPTYPNHIRYGASSSPTFAGGLLILYQDREWAETPDVGWLAGIDPETGDVVWRNEWSNSCCAYTTPNVWRRGEGAPEELLVAESAKVVSYDPATGAHLWTAEHGQLQTVSSLNIIDDEVVCALGGAHHDKGNTCFRVIGTGADTQVEQLWDLRKRAPESASPIYYEGRLWSVTEAGVMSCYDPYSGKLHWLQRLKKGRDFRSSLVAGDGKIYAQSTFYVTAVIDATAKTLEVLSYSSTPEGGNNATPAIADGCLILRTHDHLYCIESEAESQSKSDEAGDDA